MARRSRRPEPDAPGPVMTVDQVAAYLQLNRLTVYRYVRDGRIPSARFGKVYRILKADVDRFLESQKLPTQPTEARREEPGTTGRRRIRAVWVRDKKDPREIYVGPSGKEPPPTWDPLFPNGDPVVVITRNLN